MKCHLILSKLADPPTIKVIPDHSIKAGDTLSITCKVTSSNPAPNDYKWSKVGDRTFSKTGPVLTIPNIERRHAGTYRCTAVNTMVPTNGSSQQGTDTEDVAVDVLCTLTKVLHFFLFYAPYLECKWLNIKNIRIMKLLAYLLKYTMEL